MISFLLRVFITTSFKEKKREGNKAYTFKKKTPITLCFSPEWGLFLE